MFDCVLVRRGTHTGSEGNFQGWFSPSMLWVSELDLNLLGLLVINLLDSVSYIAPFLPFKAEYSLVQAGRKEIAIPALPQTLNVEITGVHHHTRHGVLAHQRRPFLPKLSPTVS